jgi:actin related protein 2/3 complex subunit 5
MSKVVERKVAPAPPSSAPSSAKKESASQGPVSPAGKSPSPSAGATGATAKEGKSKSSKKKAEEDDDDEEGEEGGAVKEDKKGQEDAAALRADVEPILKSNQFAKALCTALTFKSHSGEVSKVASELALAAMDNIKTDEVSKIVENADSDYMDALMRTAYAGMAIGRNCATMLIWHQKLSEKGGLGVVMRAMCARSN